MVFDLVGILDSSSTIGLKDWGLEVDLISQIMWHFNVGQDAVRVGAFHYNNKVYTGSQFHLNQVSSNQDLTNRLLNWNYEGVGTLTGQALAHARDVSLAASNGNRAGVKDIIVLITDGVSQDDYAAVTAALMGSDVTLIVVGIGFKYGSREMLKVASMGHHFVAVERNDGNLRWRARAVAQHIASVVCPGGPWLPPKSPPLWRNRCIKVAQNPRNGRVSCTDNRERGSVCTFSCDRGFRVLGHRTTRCQANRWWTNPHAICRPDRRQCRPLVAPVGGSMSCTKSTHNRAWSDCHFTCDAPGFIVGQPKLECRPFGDGNNDVAWNFNEPICASVQCPVMKPIKYGTTTCSAENNVGSVCEHVCNEGLTHYPPHKNVTECILAPDGDSANFRPGKPCCVDAVRLATETCPPLPNLDVVVVVDSSSSVKIHNWEPQMNFVKKVVSVFDVGIDKTRIGVFRYNKLIDASTEIKLADATNLENLLIGIDAIPYDGSGTLTGAAINYTLTNHLSADYGNRPGVDDFVIVITDGRSQDDVVVPSELVRNSGAMVFAVGVGLKENGLQTMNDIAGDPDYAFNVVGGFAALDGVVDEINDLLKKAVCHPCKRLRYTPPPPTEPAPLDEAASEETLEETVDETIVDPELEATVDDVVALLKNALSDA